MRNPEFPANSLVMQTKWIAELISGAIYDAHITTTLPFIERDATSALQRHAAAYERDASCVKHGVVFFDRSPLTPAIYASRDPNLDAHCKTYLLHLSLQIFSTFRNTLLLCAADPYAVALRRSHRLMQVHLGHVTSCARTPLHLSLALPEARDTCWAQSVGPVASIRQTLGEADAQLQDDVSRT